MCHALAKRLGNVCGVAYLLYQKIKQKLVHKHTLKDIIEKEARKKEEETEDLEEEQTESEVDLAPQDHERALKEAYGSFVILDSPKVVIYGC